MLLSSRPSGTLLFKIISFPQLIAFYHITLPFSSSEFIVIYMYLVCLFVYMLKVTCSASFGERPRAKRSGWSTSRAQGTFVKWWINNQTCLVPQNTLVHSELRISFFFFFGLFRAPTTAYGGSQGKGWIKAVAASLGHSNTRSEPHLRPTPQFMATLDP